MPDRIDEHNAAQIDRARATLVGLLARAVTEKQHGSLTLRIEWRNHLLSRLVTTEEESALLAVKTRDDN